MADYHTGLGSIPSIPIKKIVVIINMRNNMSLNKIDVLHFGVNDPKTVYETLKNTMTLLMHVNNECVNFRQEIDQLRKQVSLLNSRIK